MLYRRQRSYFNLSIPFEDNNSFQPKYIAPQFALLMSHTLSERFSLSYNFGGEWDGDRANATGIYTVSFGISFTEKLDMFVESYGFLTQDDSPDHRLDGGFAYLFLPNLQADVSGGIGVTDNSPDYFLGAGLSIRLPR